MTVGRLVRAIFALAALIALVVGVPAALIATVGNPLHARDDLVAGDINTQVFIGLISVVVWAAWAQFAAAVAAEVVTSLRAVSTPVHIPFVPGFNRRLAQALVATALLAGTAAVAASHAASAAANVPTTESITASVRTIEASVSPKLESVSADRPSAVNVPVTTYVVPPDGSGPDTYWDIAAAHLGSGSEWRRIWELNQGRTQPDGAVMNDPGLLRPGWTVVVPPSTDDSSAVQTDRSHAAGQSVDTVTVRPGDTLSGLAASHGVDDWRDVWSVSRGRNEPDGARFTDPDLLMPGWTVRLPATDAPRPRDSDAVPPAELEIRPPNAPQPTTRPPVAPPASSDATPPPRSPSAETSSGPLSPASPTLRNPSPKSPAGAQHASSSQSTERQTLAFLGGGVLLAGMALTALITHRRRQFRWRRPGRAISRTPPELVDVERQVAAVGSTAVADLAWLDEALRSLTHPTTVNGGPPLPDVVAVRMTSETIELVLTAAHSEPPAPWTADPESASRWTVRRHDELSYDPAAREHQAAPFPALASIGYTSSGEYWLLDLERVAAIALRGDADLCLDLARFMAAELAHNPWSEALQVTMVGFGRELIDFNPDRLSYTEDLAGLLVSLRQQLDQVHARGADDVNSHVVLVAPHCVADRHRLNEVLSRMRERPGRTGVALVLTEQSEETLGTRWELSLDAEGFLLIPALGQKLTALRLPQAEASKLAKLISSAAVTDDVEMPAAAPCHPQDQHADAAGALRMQAGDASDMPPSAATLAEVASVDPTLDVDLAAWRDPENTRPKVHLLGNVHVDAHGELPTQSPRLAWNTEVVAYLATHPEGVTAERFGTDLWPDDPDIVGKTRIRQAILVARKWLGTDEHDRDYLPKGTTSIATDGVAKYELVNELVDAELFRRLRIRGHARGADGIEDLWRALHLVTGPPFSGRRPGGYSWLVEGALDHVYAAMVADTSHAVALHHLGRDEPQRAADAAQVALLAGSTEDTPLLDLLAASDALGTEAESSSLVGRIMRNHDAEIEEDLPPRTFAALLSRTSGGSAEARDE